MVTANNSIYSANVITSVLFHLKSYCSILFDAQNDITAMIPEPSNFRLTANFYLSFSVNVIVVVAVVSCYSAESVPMSHENSGSLVKQKMKTKFPPNANKR